MSDSERIELAVTRGADQKFCWDCGEAIPAQAAFCQNCGARQNEICAAAPEPPPIPVSRTSEGRSKLVAGLLALFLGGLGVHKFYLGQAGQGIIYLLLCWTFVPAIIAFIEGLSYLAMRQRDFDRKYNTGR